MIQRSLRIVLLLFIVLTCSAIFGVCFHGLGGWHGFAFTLGLSQQGGLTPPPRPVATETRVVANTGNEAAPILVGERLAYNISWSRFTSAARLELEVAERGAFFGQEGYQVRSKLETGSDVRSLFFDLYHQYTVYLAARNLQPYRLESSVRQGQSLKDEIALIDQHKHEARYLDDSTVSFGSDVFDFTSLLYALRQRPLTEGASYSYTVLYGKQTFEVEAEVKKRERVIAQVGTYNTVRVEVQPKGKYSKYRVRIWFSDDSQRLPIAFAAALSFGEVRAELTNATLAMRSARLPITPETEATESRNGLNPPPAAGRALPFALGERLNYDIAWGNFNGVGKASFEVRQQGASDDGARQVMEFAAEAASIGAARSLAPVNDQLTSFVNLSTLEPLKTETRLREGRRVKDVTATYDQTGRFARLTNTTVVTLPSRAYDLLSLFYVIRAEDLRIGMQYRYAFLDANHRLRGVTVKVARQETISTMFGARSALQLDIVTPDQEQLIAQAWISDDARRLPFYFATRTRFGELRFQLNSAVNLR